VRSALSANLEEEIMTEYLIPVKCPRCGNMEYISGDRRVICSACKNGFNATPVSSSVKICIDCGKWVFRHLDACPKCHKNSFSFDPDFRLKRLQAKTSGLFVVGLAIGLLFTLVLAPYTVGLSLPVTFILAWKLISFTIEVGGEIKSEKEGIIAERVVFSQEVAREMSEKVAVHESQLSEAERRVFTFAFLGNSQSALQAGNEALSLGSKSNEVLLVMAICAQEEGLKEDANKYADEISGALSDTQYSALCTLYSSLGRISRKGINNLFSMGQVGAHEFNTRVTIAKSLLWQGEINAARRIVDDIDHNAQGIHPVLLIEIQKILAIIQIYNSSSDGTVAEIVSWGQSNSNDHSVALLALEKSKLFNAPMNEVFPLYEAQLQADATDIETADTLFSHYIKTGAIQDCERVFRSLSADIQANARIAYRMAVVLLKSGALDKAVPMLQRITDYQRVPRDQVKRALGMCYEQKGVLDLAMNTYKEIHDLTKRIDAMFSLGMKAQEMGQFATARSCYAIVYSLNAEYRDVSVRLDQMQRSA
jgi:tetratricopeptide (TPR) repeat protein